MADMWENHKKGFFALNMNLSSHINSVSSGKSDISYFAHRNIILPLTLA